MNRNIVVIVSDGENDPDLLPDEFERLINLATRFKSGGGTIACVGVRAAGHRFRLLRGLATPGFFINVFGDAAAVASARASLLGSLGQICASSVLAIPGPQSAATNPLPSLEIFGNDPPADLCVPALAKSLHRVFFGAGSVYSAIPGDPTLPNLIGPGAINYGLVSFALTVTPVSPGVNKLDWTYPPTMVGSLALNVPGIGPGAGTKHWPGVKLYIVRSAANAVIDPAFADASILLSDGLNLSGATMDAYVAALSGATWAPISTVAAANLDAWPITYTDSAAPTTKLVSSYRLVAFLGYFERDLSHTDVFANGRWLGLVWNSVSVVRPFTNNPTRPANVTLLTWLLPDLN